MQKSYCKNCVEELVGGKCPCGCKEEESVVLQDPLLKGTRLGDRYFVGKKLGQGGYGITYLGRDLLFDEKVAIKEYFPKDIAGRSAKPSNDVLCKDGKDYEVNKKHFNEYLEKCIEEAQNLAKFKQEEGIVSVIDYFRMNGTAYIVMKYVDGITLEEYVQENGPFTDEAILELMKPLMCALTKVHNAGIIHRDISPDNILICDGKLVLIDFGAAKEDASPKKSSRPPKKEGYSPLEIYLGEDIGPYSDVYSLCATIYYCLTGKVPLSATKRYHDKRLERPREVLGHTRSISDKFEEALLKGMSVESGNRYKTMDTLMDAFENSIVCENKRGSDVSSKLLQNELRETTAKSISSNMGERKSQKYVLLIILCMLLLGGGVAVGVMISGGRSNKVIEQDDKGINTERDDSLHNNEVGNDGSGDDAEKKEVSIKFNHYFANVDGETYERDTTNDARGFSGEKLDIAKHALSKEGFLFVGAKIANGNADLVPDAYVSEIVLKEGQAEEINLYYDREQYSVFVESDGHADVSGSGKYYYGAEVLIKCVPEVGYSFIGWDGGEELHDNTEMTSFVMPNSDLSLKAKVKANTYKITFDSLGGTEVADIVVTYDDRYVFSSPSSRTGYSFEGWYTEKTGGVEVNAGDEVKITSDITLYAHWTVKSGISYTVNHYQEKVSGSGYLLYKSEEKSGKAEAKLTLSSLAKDYNGFKYVGACAGTKSSASPGSYVSTSTVLPDGTRVINVYYDRNEHKVTFDANGGVVTSGTKKVSFGAKLDDFPIPTREYYEFVGWTYNGEVVSDITVKSDITLLAKWKEKEKSGWILSTKVPSSAKIVDTKWTYVLKETTESELSTLEGWKYEGERQEVVAAGAFEYASFPEGFSTSSPIYSEMYKNKTELPVPEGAKRTIVSDQAIGFVYWHWSYPLDYPWPVTDRLISNKYNTLIPSCGHTTIFCAFKSSKEYSSPLNDVTTGWPVYKIEDTHTSYAESGGSYWWYRFPYYSCSYEDVKTIYQYYKETKMESLVGEPKGEGVSNIEKWVKYVDK